MYNKSHIFNTITNGYKGKEKNTKVEKGAIQRRYFCRFINKILIYFQNNSKNTINFK